MTVKSQFHMKWSIILDRDARGTNDFRDSSGSPCPLNAGESMISSKRPGLHRAGYRLISPSSAVGTTQCPPQPSTSLRHSLRSAVNVITKASRASFDIYIYIRICASLSKDTGKQRIPMRPNRSLVCVARPICFSWLFLLWPAFWC